MIIEIIETKVRQGINISLFKIKRGRKIRYHATYHKEELTADLLKESYPFDHPFDNITTAKKRFNKMINTPVKFRKDDSKRKNQEKKEAKMKKNRELMERFKNIFGFSLPTCGIATVLTGSMTIDIVRFDNMLERHIIDYDARDCMYKGKPDYSVKMVVQEHYGDEAIKLLNELM